MHGRNTQLIRRYYPSYESPKRWYERTLAELVKPGSTWLDLGCGRAITADRDLDRELVARARLVVGCDLDPHLRRHPTIRALALANGEALPFAAESFDLVTCSMVAEHLQHPQRAFAEVARVLRPGGHFVVFTPNKWNYAMLVSRLTPHAFHLWYKRVAFYLNRGEWRDFEDDVFPTYYRANSERALRELARGCGMEVVRLQHLALAHSFGFVRPLYILSLLHERLIDRLGLHRLKADLLAVFRKAPAQPSANVARSAAAPAAAG